jgi:dCTP deaminase
MFWSKETIQQKLHEIIFDEAGNPIGNPNNFDCTAYTLTVGPEVYVTPTQPARNLKDGAIVKLEKGEDFKIPAGQFVFLITEEFLNVPKNAIGFVSLKTSSLKFKGLINVSGFHVDPGYKGRFMFSAYNAGPTEIPVQRGEPLANIWFASLDQETKGHYTKPGLTHIPSSTIAGITGEIFSPMAIKERLEQLEAKVENQKNIIFGLVLVAIAAAFLSVAINLNAGWVKERFFSDNDIQKAKIETPAQNVKQKTK